jgi:acetyl-CoA synthetase
MEERQMSDVIIHHDDDVIPVDEQVSERALIDRNAYESLYEESVRDPEGFWRKQGETLDWITPYTKIKNTTYNSPVSI